MALGKQEPGARSVGWKLVELWKSVRDLEPGCLGADKDMRGWSDRRRVDQRAQGDMGIGSVADLRIDQRAAAAAMGVVVAFTEARDVVPTAHHGQVFHTDAGKRLESGSGRTPAVRAMAVECILEGIVDLVAHSTTKAFAAKAQSLSHSIFPVQEAPSRTPISSLQRKPSVAPVATKASSTSCRSILAGPQVGKAEPRVDFPVRNPQIRSTFGGDSRFETV